MGEWKQDFKNWSEAVWTWLKAELDSLTFYRFTDFWCKEVLCCDQLYDKWKLIIGDAMEAMASTYDELKSGSVTSRSGSSVSAGGVTVSTTNSINSIMQGNDTHLVLIFRPLLLLLEQYGLTYPCQVTYDHRCGTCDSCVEDCGCGGLDC